MVRKNNNNYSITYQYRYKKEQPAYMKYLELGAGIGIALLIAYGVYKQSDSMQTLIREKQGIEQKVEK